MLYRNSLEILDGRLKAGHPSHCSTTCACCFAVVRTAPICKFPSFIDRCRENGDKAPGLIIDLEEISREFPSRITMYTTCSDRPYSKRLLAAKVIPSDDGRSDCRVSPTEFKYNTSHSPIGMDFKNESSRSSRGGLGLYRMRKRHRPPIMAKLLSGLFASGWNEGGRAQAWSGPPAPCSR